MSFRSLSILFLLPILSSPFFHFTIGGVGTLLFYAYFYLNGNLVHGDIRRTVAEPGLGVLFEGEGEAIGTRERKNGFIIIMAARASSCTFKYFQMTAVQLRMAAFFAVPRLHWTKARTGVPPCQAAPVRFLGPVQ